jgi:hypothetical protein
MHRQQVALESTLCFETPAGPLTVQALSLQQVLDEDTRVRVMLSIKLSENSWALVEREAIFHLDPESRGVAFGDGLQPQEPVELDLVLEPTLLHLLGAHIQTAQDLAGVLSSSRVLLGSEDWYAVHVKQQNGDIKIGFRTEWYNRLG